MVSKNTTPVRIVQYAVVWFLLFCIITGIGGYISRSIRISKTRTEKSNIAEIFHNSIQEHIRTSEKILHSLAQTPSIREAMNKQTLDTTIVHPLLTTTKKYLEASIVYIMDSSGTVIACSPYDDNKTLRGNNYSFRPYFTSAMEGTGILYPAHGVTTNQKGLYYSTPITDTDGSVLGVIVIKSSLDVLQKQIDAQKEPALLVSPKGVVFATNRKSYEYTLVRSLPPQEIKAIEESKQFSNISLKTSTLDLAKTTGIIENRSYTLFAKKITQDGWSIVLCQDMSTLSPLSGYEHNIFRVSYVLLLLLGTLFLILHINMRLRYNAQNEFKAIFDSTFQNMIILSTDGIILKMNQAALSFKKRIHDDFTGNHFSQISWWDKSNITEEQIEKQIQLAARGETVCFEAELQSVRDETYYFDISIKPFYSKDMRIAMLIVEARDISRIKKISHKLNYMEEFLRNIVDSMPSMVVCIDADMHITHWNKEAEIISSISRKQALEEPLLKMLPQLQQKIPGFTKALSSKEVASFSKVPLLFNKTKLITNITSYHIQNSNDSGVVIRIDDITKNTLMEEKLQQSQKMDAIGQLAGGIAHDFNNLLTGIMGALDLFQLDDSERPFLVDVIGSAVKSGADLTHKLLNFSRSEEAKVKAISVHKAIEDAVTILTASLKKEISISQELHAKDDTILGTFGEIQNVIINLCINASHAMERGTIRIESQNRTLTAKQSANLHPELNGGEYLEVRIIDSGHGIDEKNLEKVFEPFFTTKEEGEGTGLGLATVLAIITKHKGAVKIDSQVGVGTCFTLYLPLEKHLHISEIKGLKEFREPTHGTILVLEENPLVRFTTAELLRSMGYSVIITDTFEHALENFRKRHERIDLIILSEENAENIHSFFLEDVGIPILITTVNLDTLDKSALIEKGVNNFVEKPFGLMNLQNAIERTIAQKE